jgi:hypothetical protein
MHQIALLSIAVLALLAGAAIGKAPVPEPAARKRARDGAIGLKHGGPLTTDGGPKRIPACSGC